MNIKKLRKIGAYVYMPLIFTILGFAIVYFLFAPLINIGVSVANMVIADHVSNFQDNNSNVYKQSSALSGTISSSEIEFPKYGDHYANLSCERIALTPKYFYDIIMTYLQNGFIVMLLCSIVWILVSAWYYYK